MKKSITVLTAVFTIICGAIGLAQTNSVPQASPTDVELRQKIIGVWKDHYDFLGTANDDTYTFATNGYYAKQTVSHRKGETQNSLGTGTWGVKNGILVVRLTKVDPPLKGPAGADLARRMATEGFIVNRKIISVNGHELELETSESRGTMKWVRQESPVQTK